MSQSEKKNQYRADLLNIICEQFNPHLVILLMLFSPHLVIVLMSCRQWDSLATLMPPHDDVIKWKHFPCYWPFVCGIHRWLVNSLHKGQWHRALIFSSICAWIEGWVNNHEAGDLRCHRTHYDVTVMLWQPFMIISRVTGTMIGMETCCCGHAANIGMSIVRIMGKCWFSIIILLRIQLMKEIPVEHNILLLETCEERN